MRVIGLLPPVTLSTFPTEVIVQSGSTNVDVYVYEILKREGALGREPVAEPLRQHAGVVLGMVVGALTPPVRVLLRSTITSHNS